MSQCLAMVLRVSRVVSMQGQIRPPSDKSLTHRAFMFGAIAREASVIRRPLTGEDAISTVRCLEALGTQIEWNTFEEAVVTPRPWSSPLSDLDCENSGTTMRLLAGLIASRPLAATMVGDASLSRRPMKRIADPLRLMGATVEGETPPLLIQGGHLQGIDYASPVASAQIKSAVLLAGLQASGETWVREPAPSRDHTERMLAALGIPVLLDPDRGVGVSAGTPNGFTFTVPGDISSAAFWIVAAACLPDSSIELLEVGVNPTRTGILDVLKQVGVAFWQGDERNELGEPVATISLKGDGLLQPFVIEGDLVPRLVDEIPVLSVLASQCDGVSFIRDARELRVKESDRIETVAVGLRAMGAEVETFEDGLSVAGPVQLQGADIDAHGDHRIAMAFAIAGLLAEGETRISGSEAIETSYPEFERHLWRLAVV